MIRELDTVVLTRDVDEHDLKQGDVGAVVHSYRDGSALEVEFVRADGKTIAVLTLTPTDVRPIEADEILHARGLRDLSNATPATCRGKTYRRKRAGVTWCWCSDCSCWPTSDYEESETKPTTGELCNECRAKEMAATRHE